MKVALLAIPALFFSGCASTGYVKRTMRASNETSKLWGVQPRALAMSSWVIVLPATFAWDVVTFPVQLIGGYYPYGDKLRQDR